jgi:hypothetical protein
MHSKPCTVRTMCWRWAKLETMGSQFSMSGILIGRMQGLRPLSDAPLRFRLHCGHQDPIPFVQPVLAVFSWKLSRSSLNVFKSNLNF